MATVKEQTEAIRKASRERKNEEFRNWQIEKFGRLLERGDVLLMGKWDVINGGVRHNAPDEYQMVVYKIFPDYCEDRLERVGLIKAHNNHPDADPEENYCLGYGKTRLKNAKLIGKTEILVTDENVW